MVLRGRIPLRENSLLKKSLTFLLPDHIIILGCGFIQGSAADIIKIAMINIYSAIADDVDTATSSSSTESRFHMLKGRCRILLQVSFPPFLYFEFCFFPYMQYRTPASKIFILSLAYNCETF